MKLDESKREEARAKARMPPGTRLMTDQERTSTLDELHRQKKEVSDVLFSIPLSLKTDALKNKKRELEAKLVDIERAVTTFSRRVVYIKDCEEVPPHTVPLEVAFQKPPAAARPLTAKPAKKQQ
jgi:hypothetical protein